MGDALDDLERITRMVLDVELARLKALSEEMAPIQLRLSALAGEKEAWSARVADQGASDDLAFLAGRDQAWLAWLMRERARLNAELAQAAALREQQRKTASRAFGRVEAVKRLQERGQEERRLFYARRRDSA